MRHQDQENFHPNRTNLPRFYERRVTEKSKQELSINSKTEYIEVKEIKK